MANLTSSAPISRRRIIAYWVTTALVVFELATGGAWDVLRVPQVRELIEHLGYPAYFLVILGTWKLLGAVALVIPGFPRLKEWAYAGVFFDLTGAVASLLASGFRDAGTIAYPIVMTGIAVMSWALRPPSRRLPWAGSLILGPELHHCTQRFLKCALQISDQAGNPEVSPKQHKLGRKGFIGEVLVSKKKKGGTRLAPQCHLG